MEPMSPPPPRTVLVLLTAALMVTVIGCPPPPPDLEGLEVAIVPTAPLEGEALEAMVLVDPFGFAEEEFRYAYAWTVDEVAVPEWVARSIEAGETEAGQLWRVTVTPLLDGWRDDPEVFTGTAAVAQASISGRQILDADGDGFEGDVGDGSDCDDNDPTVFPGAPEDCDGVDDDCDGVPDDTADLDGDGVYDCDDCDDEDAANFPDNPEVCDGQDNDCDEEADEEMPDEDDDGVDVCDDCDDDDPDVFPGNTETCEPGGLGDQVDNDCFAGNASNGMLYWFRDDDGDGWGEEPPALWCGPPPDGYVASSGDCNDDDEEVSPSVVEVPGNGVDDDCDGDVDE
jgi:hypothetical protein